MSLEITKITQHFVKSGLLAICFLAHSPLYSIHKRAELIITAEASAPASNSLFASLADYCAKNTPQKIKALRLNLNNTLIDVESGTKSLGSAFLETEKASCKLLGMMVRENSNTILAVLASGGIIYFVDLTCNDGKLMNAVRDYANSAKDYLKYYTVKIKDGVSNKLSSLQNVLTSTLGVQHPATPVVIDTTSLREVAVDTVPVDPIVETNVLDPLQPVAPLDDQSQSIIIITQEAPIIVHLDPNMLMASLGEAPSRRPDEPEVTPRDEQIAPPVVDQPAATDVAPDATATQTATDTAAAIAPADIAPTSEEVAPVDQPVVDATPASNDVAIQITVTPADAIVVTDSSTPNTVTVEASVPVDATIPAADETVSAADDASQPAKNPVAPKSRRRLKKH